MRMSDININEDLVFTGFILRDSFSDTVYNSKDWGLYRVSNNNRYSETLTPTFEDKTVHVPGQAGSYYFGTKYKDKPISIQVAFDNLTIDKYEEMVSVFEGLVAQAEPTPLQLIFDDTPYKMNLVYLQNPPTFSYVPFDENGDVVLKGEGTLNFICYEPFARSVNKDYVLAINGTHLGLGQYVPTGPGMSQIDFNVAEIYYLTHRIKWANDDYDNDSIVNLGDFDISPIIKIYKNNSWFTNNITEVELTIECKKNAKPINYFKVDFPSTATYIIIDTANSQAYTNTFQNLEIKYDYDNFFNETNCNIKIPSCYQKIINDNLNITDEFAAIGGSGRIIDDSCKYYITVYKSSVQHNNIELIYDYLYM